MNTADNIHDRLARNHRSILDRMAAACSRVGRDPASVALVAVTKSARPEWIRELVGLGQTELAENRPQQLVERAAQIEGPVHWHLIGHLQRNKARQLLPIVSLIHSVDSLRLLMTLDQLAAGKDLQPRVLLEVNVSGEASKDGFRVDELLAAWDQVIACRHVRVEGLMTMAPLSDRPSDARSTFAGLRDLRDQLRTRSPADVALPHLSMGMSGDFEIAIEEGATLVRVGSALFDGMGNVE
ncbi:MAG: YggS family pyridoxal phosphate-dependent enzyme [Planctomycetales bacterium]|nr:YggS family pyridoxal phosphate-dependent enzyme [Planctomycetales bacterium]